MSTDTLLKLGDIVFPAGSARGISQTLQPIQGQTQLRRTVNGELVDISNALFRKYASTVTCRDQKAPTFDAFWTGQEIVVDCMAELSYVTAGGSPARPVVTGSSRTEGTVTFYRPQITMIVTGFQVDEDEWGARVGWTLQLEEK